MSNKITTLPFCHRQAIDTPIIKMIASPLIHRMKVEEFDPCPLANSWSSASCCVNIWHSEWRFIMYVTALTLPQSEPPHQKVALCARNTNHVLFSLFLAVSAVMINTLNYVCPRITWEREGPNKQDKCHSQVNNSGSWLRSEQRKRNITATVSLSWKRFYFHLTVAYLMSSSPCAQQQFYVHRHPTLWKQG